ncbi:hypothetical protein LT493_12280 [Streptomyces tricolor]|nr:hypothetical protein [Streptomyces tricolor]
MSWYGRLAAERQGARISVVSWDATGDPTYQHVLLVEPYGLRDDGGERYDFRESDLHAGGIAWYGNKLYVADSTVGTTGLRVYDLDRIFKVTKGPGLGRQADGTYHAHGYDYVLPQCSRLRRLRQRDTEVHLLTGLPGPHQAPPRAAGERVPGARSCRLARWELGSPEHGLPEQHAILLASRRAPGSAGAGVRSGGPTAGTTSRRAAGRRSRDN